MVCDNESCQTVFGTLTLHLFPIGEHWRRGAMPLDRCDQLMYTSYNNCQLHIVTGNYEWARLRVWQWMTVWHEKKRISMYKSCPPDWTYATASFGAKCPQCKVSYQKIFFPTYTMSSHGPLVSSLTDCKHILGLLVLNKSTFGLFSPNFPAKQERHPRFSVLPGAHHAPFVCRRHHRVVHWVSTLLLSIVKELSLIALASIGIQPLLEMYFTSETGLHIFFLCFMSISDNIDY